MFQIHPPRTGRISSYVSNIRKTFRHLNPATPLIRSSYVAQPAPLKRTTATTAEMGQGKADAQHQSKTTRSCTPEEDSASLPQNNTEHPMTSTLDSNPAACASCTPALTGAARETLSTCLAVLTGRRLEEQKKEIIDRLMHAFETWLLDQLIKFEEAYDGDGDNFRREPGRSGGMRPTGGRNGGTGSRAGQKRGLDGDDGDGSSADDNGSGGGENRRRIAAKRTKTQHHHLACPYQKRDPERHRRCIGIGPGWENFSRVKEHVQRNHGLPFFCDRCQKGFKLEADRTRHIRSAVPCPVVDAPDRRDPIEGFDRSKGEQLKGKKPPYMSEEEKWREMYRLLFDLGDDEEVPSPYFDEGDVIISKAQKITAVVQERLPPLFKKHLEESLDIESRGLEHRLAAKAVQVFEKVLFNIVRGNPGAAGEGATTAATAMPSMTTAPPVAAPPVAADSLPLELPQAMSIITNTMATVNPMSLGNFGMPCPDFTDFLSSGTSSLVSGSDTSGDVSTASSLDSSMRSSRESTPPGETLPLWDESGRYYLSTKPEDWLLMNAMGD